jgi:Uma2 family endonuclease
VLEIMVLSVQHEEMNRLIHDLLTVVAEERGIDFFNAGSTTFKREELERGFEPDTCFYIRGAAVVRGKGEIDLAIDPPPDIVIEVEISRSTIDKLDILRAVGVPEVWRYRPGTLTLFRLTEAGYRPSPESALFPGVTGDALSRLLEDGRRLNRSSWLRAVRAWARQLA